MKVEAMKYVIATNSFPLLFEDDEAEDTEYLENAAFYKSVKDANYELGRFDEPETRRIMSVKVIYEI